MKGDLESIENFGFTIRKDQQNDYENACPSGQSCCIPKPKKLICDENDGYKCHPSLVCFLFVQTKVPQSLILYLIFQKCDSSKVKGRVSLLGDFNYEDEESTLVSKKGDDENEYCPIGELCCIPETPKCEDTKGHRCVERDVSALHTFLLKRYCMCMFLLIHAKYH